MRISSGTFKGRAIGKKKLFGKRTGQDELRPTPSKVREAIFDILRGELEGSSFLDLYAGSGTIGIEAASRGAGRIVFVEAVRSRSRAIQEDLERIGFGGRAEIHCEQAETFLMKASRSGERYDIIFADPPYASGEIEKILPLIEEYGILDAQGVIVCEHSKKKKVPERIGTLACKRQYRYGDTMLALYRKEG
jgi:16S rRNA (guanine(966)-N(2))-methyltransferase RsmD